jgi:hypothetical protein
VDPRSTEAQERLAELTATPDAAAELFLRSVRSIRWSAATQFLHAGTLERFRRLVEMMVEADSTGEVRAYLTETDSAGFARLDPPTVFHRAVGTMIDDMPGLMHALFDRDDQVLGHVLEATDTAHVVYRSTPRLSGAVSEVKVMQAVRTPAGWRIQWSDELEVLETALRGLPRTRPRSPGTGSTS